MSQSSYDQTPYMNIAFADSHPRRIQAVAHLFGMDSASSADCSVLELGCAVGGNIVPMACSMPKSRFVGIDLSESQIAKAREFAGGVSAKNLDLRAASITDVTPHWGKFDYIICHGVFSWVPIDVQEKILQICGEQLTDRGVAYVSFNTFPGWHTRRWMREAMLFHTTGIADPAERARAGREFIVALSESPFAPADKVAALQAEAAYMRGKPESYILHEYLEDNNRPMYFQDFARSCAARGLQYLGDARRNSGLEMNWPPAKRWLDSSGGDVVRTEQYLDFVDNRMFRRALICPAAVSLDRAGAANRLEGMWAETFVRQWAAGNGVTRFEHPNGMRYTSSSQPLRTALAAITERFPKAISVNELLACEQKREIAQGLVQCWRIGLVRMYVEPPAFALVGEKPRVWPVGQYLAARGQAPINLRHENVPLSPEHGAILPLLDGSRSRQQLAGDSGLSIEAVDRALSQLATAALLEQ